MARAIRDAKLGTRSTREKLKIKAVADYAIGDDARLTQSEADEAIGGAARFVDCIAELLQAA